MVTVVEIKPDEVVKLANEIEKEMYSYNLEIHFATLAVVVYGLLVKKMEIDLEEGLVAFNKLVRQVPDCVSGTVHREH